MKSLKNRKLGYIPGGPLKTFPNFVNLTIKQC